MAQNRITAFTDVLEAYEDLPQFFKEETSAAEYGISNFGLYSRGVDAQDVSDELDLTGDSNEMDMLKPLSFTTRLSDDPEVVEREVEAYLKEHPELLVAV